MILDPKKKRGNDKVRIKIYIQVLLTSASGTLFKHSKLENYSLKKLNNSISNTLNAQVFIKSFCLKPLKSAPEKLVNISLYIYISHLCIPIKSFFF